MSHARTQIRNAIFGILDTAIANITIQKSRIYPIGSGKLPAILIYTRQENLQDSSLSKPRTQFRNLSLVIEVIAKANNDLDQTLDDLAVQIEEALFVDTSLGGLVKDTILQTTDIQYLDEGDKPHGVMVMTYTITYAVQETTPETLI